MNGGNTSVTVTRRRRVRPLPGKFSKWIRFTVYGYLDLKDMFKVAVLCRGELDVKNSEIAREGKSIMLQLQNQDPHYAQRREGCLLHGRAAAWLQVNYGAALDFVEKIHI